MNKMKIILFCLIIIISCSTMYSPIQNDYSDDDTQNNYSDDDTQNNYSDDDTQNNYSDDDTQQLENKHVFLIGLDGWGGFSFNDPSFDMPVVKEIIQESSFTFSMINVLPCNTMPNWASMLMGAEPEVHGIPDNDIISSPSFFPSVFTLLKKQRPDYKVAYFFEWDPLGYLCPDNIIDTKKIITWGRYDSEVLKIANYIKIEKPNLMVIIFNSPDGVGHSYGFGSPEYYKKLKEMDRHINTIFSSIHNAGIWDSSVIIMSADHGGVGTGHGGNSPLGREIPFIITGKNIRPNNRITEPARIYDIAATIANIFELDVPSSWQGKILDVFK